LYTFIMILIFNGSCFWDFVPHPVDQEVRAVYKRWSEGNVMLVCWGRHSHAFPQTCFSIESVSQIKEIWWVKSTLKVSGRI
jgi:hypothetical protein